MGMEDSGRGGEPEDTLVEDQLPRLVSCVLGQMDGPLPPTLLGGVIERALDASLVALLRQAGEDELADEQTIRSRGWPGKDLVARLAVVQAVTSQREIVHPPLLRALEVLLATARRCESHDASPREILTMALAVARFAGRLEEEHRLLLATCLGPREDAERLRELVSVLEADDPAPAAIAELQSLADQGVAGALTILGTLHAVGLGVPLDGARGAWLLAEAAALGDVTACSNLATHYTLGMPPFAPNPAKARLFLQLCRDRGFPV